MLGLSVARRKAQKRRKTRREGRLTRGETEAGKVAAMKEEIKGGAAPPMRLCGDGRREGRKRGSNINKERKIGSTNH